jgi:hypothetical protein
MALSQADSKGLPLHIGGRSGAPPTGNRQPEQPNSAAAAGRDGTAAEFHFAFRKRPRGHFFSKELDLAVGLLRFGEERIGQVWSALSEPDAGLKTGP